MGICNYILMILSYFKYKDGNLQLYIDDIVVFLGDTQNMEIKLQRLYDIYKEIKGYNGTLDLSNARENMLDEQYIFKKNWYLYISEKCYTIYVKREGYFDEYIWNIS